MLRGNSSPKPACAQQHLCRWSLSRVVISSCRGKLLSTRKNAFAPSLGFRDSHQELRHLPQNTHSESFTWVHRGNRKVLIIQSWFLRVSAMSHEHRHANTECIWDYKEQTVPELCSHILSTRGAPSQVTPAMQQDSGDSSCAEGKEKCGEPMTQQIPKRSYSKILSSSMTPCL